MVPLPTVFSSGLRHAVTSAFIILFLLHLCFAANPTFCRDGISHSPLEYVSPDDVAAATATLYQYLRKELLGRPSSPAASRNEL